MSNCTRWILLILVAILSLTSCSSKNESQIVTKQQALEPVALQIQWVTQAQFAGYYLALDKGWYREEGIELDIKPGGPDIVPVDVVASGTATFGTTLLADLSAAIEKNTPVISIAQIQQRNGLLLIARKSSGIVHPKDFIGRRVGVWLGSWEAQFNALLAREKIDANDIKVMSQGWSMTPFLKGDLEVASAMVYNEYHVVLASGIPQEDLNVIDYADFNLGFPGDVLFTTKDTAAEKPELCRRMVRASLRGWEYAMDHPDEAVEVLLKYDRSGVQTRSHQLAMMKEVTELIRAPGRQTGHIENARLGSMVELLLQYGILSSRLDPKDIFTAAFLEEEK